VQAVTKEKVVNTPRDADLVVNVAKKFLEFLNPEEIKADLSKAWGSFAQPQGEDQPDENDTLYQSDQRRTICNYCNRAVEVHFLGHDGGSTLVMEDHHSPSHDHAGPALCRGSGKSPNAKPEYKL
jgi:hypothetical protein